MRYKMLALLVVIIGIAVVVTLPKSPAETPHKAPETVTEVKTPTVKELFTLINAERAKVGVKPLVLDERLNRSAQLKADDMVANNYYGHVNPVTGFNGPDYIRQTAPGVCYEMSENITQNIYVNESSRAVQAWMASKPHHDALLADRFDLTGFGINGIDIVEHFCDLH